MFSSRHGHLDIILVLNVLDAVFCNDFDEDALEVDRETPLELLCAHSHDLETLFVVDVRVVVLVEQRETVVPRRYRVSVGQSNKLMGNSRIATTKRNSGEHTEHIHERHMVPVPNSPDSRSSTT